MGTGYTRADTANNIADGNIINASDLDSEYDAIQSAFDASTGHTHDGTAGEGAPIETIGPSQDVVATASVLRPKTDNTVDLGTTSLEYKDLFLDGTAHIDTLDVDENASITGTLGVTGTTTLGTANITTGTITTADINGGNIDGTIIGATSAAAITGTTITGTSFVTSGDMTFGDNDKAVFGADSDLQIYHDGSNSYIVDNGTGGLFQKANAEWAVQSQGSDEYFIRAASNAWTKLYYNGLEKLATSSTGVDITGTLTSDDVSIADTSPTLLFNRTDRATDNKIIRFAHDGEDFQLQLANDAVSSVTPAIAINRTGMTLDSIAFYEDTGTTAKFFWDASAETLDIGSYVGSSVNAPLNLKSDANHHGLSIEENSGTETWQLGVDVDGDLNFHNSGNATPSVTFSDSGSVGIGTSSPAEELDISADAPSMQLSSTNASGRNYGLQSTNNGKFAFYDGTAGVNRMVISSSGSVGIGASSPENSLHVSSSTATSQILVQGDSNDASIKLNKSGQTFVIGIDATDDSFRIADNPTLGTNDRLVIDASGNVGIGTSSPNSKLTLSTGDKIFVPTGEALNFGHTTGSANTERMRIDSSGNVGIGVSSISGVKMDVLATASDNLVARFENNHATGSYGISVKAGDDSGNYAADFANKSGTSLMRIRGDGNVGIGTSSPSDKLHVDGSSSTDGILIKNPLSGSFYNAKLEFTRDSTLGGAKIQTERNAAGGVGLSFNYTSSNANEVSGTYSEAMRIDSSGRVGIGTSSPDQLLHLSAGSGATIRLESTTTGAVAGDIFGAIEFETQDTNSAGIKAKIDAYSEGVVGNAALRFFTGDTTSLDEAMRIDSSGNVGFGGVTSPQAGFGVSGCIDTNGAYFARGQIASHQTNAAVLQYGNNLTELRSYGATAGSGQMRFMVGGGGGSADSEAMRLDSSGNLLVGKTVTGVATAGHALMSSGQQRATVSGDITAIHNRLTSDGDIMQFRKDGSTVGSIGTYAGDLTIGDDDIGIRFDTGSGLVPWDLGATTTGGSARDAAIDIGVASARFKDLYLSSSIKITGSGDKSISLTSGTGSTSVINMGDGDDIDAGQIVYDNANNSMQVKTNGTERMRIDSSGNLLVGTTSVFSGSGIVPLVTITGATGGIGVNSIGSAEVGLATRPSASHNYYAGFFLNNSGSGVGNITVTGSSTAYNTSSDHRLKENVVDLTGATARLNQLAPKRFNFIADADTTVDGFIAHEVQAVVPEAITGTHNEVDADGNPVYQGIDQSKLVPLLVATIKELEARITALENA